mmetsp:Transcript_24956/g.65186  ORF Transcript_24956/g.65186 Transcript_24956/m.65186 type:complete len:97 (-) Transcript_24956:210-500(-)
MMARREEEKEEEEEEGSRGPISSCRCPSAPRSEERTRGGGEGEQREAVPVVRALERRKTQLHGQEPLAKVSAKFSERPQAPLPGALRAPGSEGSSE